MAITQTSTEMDGMPSNSGLLIRAADYATGNGTIVWGTTNKVQGVRGKEVGVQLMETPWFKAGTFNNLVIPTAYLESDTTTTFQSIICLTIHKRRPGQLGELGDSKKLYIPYKSLSDTTGSMPMSQWLNQISTQFIWFDVNYEYKFEVHISSLGTGATYIALIGIYLQYASNNSVYYASQVTSGADADVGFTQAVPIIEGQWWSTTTASGAGGGITSIKTVTLTPQTYDGTGTQSGTVWGHYNTVDAVSTVQQGGIYYTGATNANANYIPYIWSYADGSSATGYTVSVDLIGIPAGTQYFFTTILGTTNAMVI